MMQDIDPKLTFPDRTQTCQELVDLMGRQKNFQSESCFQTKCLLKLETTQSTIAQLAKDPSLTGLRHL